MRRLFIVNPFDENQRSAIDSFEKQFSIHTETSSFMKRIIKSDTEEEYQWKKKNQNEIEESLYLEKDSSIIDLCHIYGEKDMKRCRISFAKIPHTKKRKLLSLATDYALSTLGMEEVFISVNPEDKALMVELNQEGYENLGEESNNILFLKEKEDISTKGSIYETI